MMDTAQQVSLEERNQRARKLAAERYRREKDWVVFYREVLGVDGVIDQLFPTSHERTEFEKTDAYLDIQQMLAKLREKNRIQKHPDEPTRVITVRLPQSLHEALRHEAHNHKTSMNKLCISKLLQVVADELVPSDFERRDSDGPMERPTDVPRPAMASTMPTAGITPQAAPRVPETPAVPQSPLQSSPQPYGGHSYNSTTMPGGRPF